MLYSGCRHGLATSNIPLTIISTADQWELIVNHLKFTEIKIEIFSGVYLSLRQLYLYSWLEITLSAYVVV